MNDDEQEIANAHAAYVEAKARRRRAIEDAMRRRSVRPSRIEKITGLTRETLRIWRNEAGIPPDERYVRSVRARDN